eukprot:scaffold28966_cov90-Isochrysis_galbana.AAC.3
MLSQVVIAKPPARRRLRDDLWTYWRGSDAVPEFPLTKSDVWTITEDCAACLHVCILHACLWESVCGRPLSFVSGLVTPPPPPPPRNYSTVQ